MTSTSDRCYAWPKVQLIKESDEKDYEIKENQSQITIQWKREWWRWRRFRKSGKLKKMLDQAHRNIDEQFFKACYEATWYW